MALEITKAEIAELWGLLDLPIDTPITFENLFKYGLDKIQPRKRLQRSESLRESMKVEFIYHGWYINCYIRFSNQKEYYGAGDSQGGRNVTTALARAILQAVKDFAEADRQYARVGSEKV